MHALGNFVALGEKANNSASLQTIYPNHILNFGYWAPNRVSAMYEPDTTNLTSILQQLRLLVFSTKCVLPCAKLNTPLTFFIFAKKNTPLTNEQYTRVKSSFYKQCHTNIYVRAWRLWFEIFSKRVICATNVKLGVKKITLIFIYWTITCTARCQHLSLTKLMTYIQYLRWIHLSFF